MDLQTTIAVAAAVIALVGAFIAGAQVREMKRQTELQRTTGERQAALQRTISEEASQPYIWADVRFQSANGWNLEFVVGNSGPTVATQVKVSIDPEFPEVDHGPPAAVYEKLKAGVSSLAPGRSLHWTLGQSAEIVNRSGSLAHTVTIAFNGPFGAVPASQYVINMADFRESVARDEGTLRDISKAVSQIADRLPRSGKPLPVEIKGQ